MLLRLRLSKWTWFLGALLGLTALPIQGRTVPDPGNPLGFFTTVADKLLRSTFPFGVTNIPVCSNGVYVYTPAVQRLLQLSANLCDAANTNFFPSVFRPLFSADGSNDVLIVGYVQVTSVSGTTDPQLATPYDVTQLTDATETPIADANGPVNAYGVPWIIGAKKGFPNFNQFDLITAAQVTRELQVARTSIDPLTAMYATNQMYIIGISNNLGMTFWNSYSNDYDPQSGAITVFASDMVSETLTNEWRAWQIVTNFTISDVLSTWPGSQWSGGAPSSTPSTSAFLPANWGFTFLSPMAYDFNTGQFDPAGSWQTTTPPLAELPQFGLLVTNYLQAFILDGSNVVDYVQLRGPVCIGGLNQGLADPDYPDPAALGTFLQWSTNLPGTGTAAPWGVDNQLFVSGHPNSAPTIGGQWATSRTPMGSVTPAAEAAYFDGFYLPTFYYSGTGKDYVNRALMMQAPYTPSRTIYLSCLLQANDPLVHYLASDLNAQTGAYAEWGNGVYWNGIWRQSDDPISAPLPLPPTSPVGGRFQPWGRTGQMMRIGAAVDASVYNLAFRDPLVWGSDYWNFPTNLMASLSGLGNVHRGTPWQTIYLKSPSVLQETAFTSGAGSYNIGMNTWAAWSGDTDLSDAALMAPAWDWQLAGLLMSILNTNDPTQLLSANDLNVADWQNVLNGLLVYSNSLTYPFPGITPQFDTWVIASNSPQASAIANAIVQTNASKSSSGRGFIGSLLIVPALTVQSPFLNFVSPSRTVQQTNYGINDVAYEAIPAQLLPFLRPDSIASLTPTNGAWNVSFSGADGYDYVLQASPDLSNWVNVATNQPVQGTLTVPASPPPGSPAQFYRTRLLPQ